MNCLIIDKYVHNLPWARFTPSLSRFIEVFPLAPNANRPTSTRGALPLWPHHSPPHPPEGAGDNRIPFRVLHAVSIRNRPNDVYAVWCQNVPSGY